MTTSGTNTRELSISTIVTRAFNLAGVYNPAQSINAHQVTMARDFLDMELDALQAEHLVLRAVDWQLVTLVAGTASYSLSDGTVDVIGTGRYVDPGDGETEHPLLPMSRDDYAALAGKNTSEGKPYRYYVHRLATISVVFYPVPDQAATVYLQRVRYLYDGGVATNTVDLERHWTKYLTYALAADVASSNSLDLNKAKWLQKQADDLKEKSKAHNVERGPAQIVLCHRTGWRR